MRPIVLTVRHDGEDGSTLCETYVSPSAIAYFKPAQRRDGTYVYFVGDAPTLRVTESPEQIMRRLEDNRASLRAEERDGIDLHSALTRNGAAIGGWTT